MRVGMVPHEVGEGPCRSREKEWSLTKWGKVPAMVPQLAGGRYRPTTKGVGG